MQVEVLNTQKHSLRFIVNGGVDNFNQKDAIYSPPDLQYESARRIARTSMRSRSVRASTRT